MTSLPPAAYHNLTLLSRWSGLGRGAVSVALVYYYFDNHALGLSHVHRATVIVRWAKL